jgi:hypothetical protein
MESFQNITDAQLKKKYIDAVGWVMKATDGRGGQRAAEASTGADSLDIYAGGTNTVVCGHWVHYTSIPNTTITMQFWNHDSNSSFPQVSVTTQNDGKINVARGTGAALATTTNAVITAATDHYVEVKVFTDNVSGTIEVWVDNVQVIDFTGDTQNAAAAGITSVRIQGMNSSALTRINDLYVLDAEGAAPFNDRLALWQVDSSLPDGDGATQDFPTLVPSSPTTPYTKVNEVEPDDDTSYVESPDAGDIELFTMANLPAFAGSTIAAVQLNYLAKKGEMGANRAMHGITRPVLTVYHGTNQGLAYPDYQHFKEVWINNPETGLPWTEAEFNASQFGVELDV